MHHVYFDESGDLGWILDQPYREGGSSRYFCIAFVILPADKVYLLSKLVRKIYKRYKLDPELEQKGMHFDDKFSVIVATQIRKLINAHDDIQLSYQIIRKSSLPPHVIAHPDTNIIYSHMVEQGVAAPLIDIDKALIVPDKRSLPAKSMTSIPDHLRISLWFGHRSSVAFDYAPRESHDTMPLIFVDWLTNFIWRHYEDGRSGAFNVLEDILA